MIGGRPRPSSALPNSALPSSALPSTVERPARMVRGCECATASSVTARCRRHEDPSAGARRTLDARCGCGGAEALCASTAWVVGCSVRGAACGAVGEYDTGHTDTDMSGLHAHGVHAGQPSHCVCEIDVCGQWRRYSCKGTLTLQWLGSGSVMSVGFNRLSSDPAASNKAAAVVGEGPSTNQTNLKTQESDL